MKARKCRRCSLRYQGELPTCFPCRAKVADAQRAYYRELRDAGLCTQCKSPVRRRVRCELCAMKNARRCRRWRRALARERSAA